jgi:predicted ArsR family transcriptional regulator
VPDDALPAAATTAPATADGTRDRVLAEVRAGPDAVAVDELAERLALHRNTIRFHTAALEADGLIEQDRRPTGGKGRPRAVYRPTPRGARSGRRNYELLSGILLAHLSASGEPVAGARAAGRAWGGRLAAAAPSPDTAERVVVDALDELGFEPRAERAGPPGEVRLHNCPFRELVDRERELVCTVHAGLLEGLVGGPRAGAVVDLEPFETPTTCLVRVGAGQAE